MSLTRESVLAMPAGKDLDLAVAVHVLGWRWVSWRAPDGPWNLSRPEQARMYRPEYTLTEPPAGAERGESYSDRYSTDISTAFAVEEELNRRGRASRYAEELVRLVSPEPPPGHCLATDPFALIHAPPDVRCRAALLTVLENQHE